MSADASSGRRRSLDDPDSLVPASLSASRQPAQQPASKPAGPAPSSNGPMAGDDDAEAPELAAMKARVAEMEAEAAKLRELTAASEAAAGGGNAASNGDGSDVNMSDEDRQAVDARSIYVGNVDYHATPEEIQQHFASCGTINRVTILFDKYTGPKGYAYVEFAEPSLVQNALHLNDSVLRGRQIKVSEKRTNIPGYSGRGGRGGRGRGGRGGYRGGYQGHGGYSPYPRGRGRGRGRGGW
ncbi:polyadenylate-binding protein 2 [Rhodotorula toruloides]|uniref:Polyadenylate-binding protein 2 n=1 Tax=Rhodotorula toruloides TaxID=5286 RepID=A0A511KHY1_RHOTO|nr:polyadenylate-binding protein 2 [Rhodotorula toruloides]